VVHGFGIVQLSIFISETHLISSDLNIIAVSTVIGAALIGAAIALHEIRRRIPKAI
jgi:hypothetical protein